MIQRIQSVYLLLTTILAGLFLTGNFFGLFGSSGQEFVMNIRGIFEVTAEKDDVQVAGAVPVLSIAILIPLLSVISLLLFRTRKRQLLSVLVLIILDLLLMGTLIYYIISFRDGKDLIPEWRLLIPLINLILFVMAYIAIRKDENLVRSYDRLR
ncbi:MAG TPA: DUF4293 family protein [Bacteroidales bacterium]|jgi:hypothetical protein|nr:DUF4293 family protein [Bacteroidales bacterium]HOX75113.1 DUF4293 family protein [Bacteroidales bacterium]HPM87142.1 DUF4293 family protein [Bacteroidales bacterium]HQM67985.1 DUF4293 family protein [Bacteroidales bacterium]